MTLTSDFPTLNLEDFARSRKVSSDLLIALIALVLLFAASPLLADSQNFLYSSNTGSASTPMNPAGVAPTSQPTTSVNVNPQPYAVTPSSQSQRSANAQQNGSNFSDPQLQQVPPCTVGDSACIEQQNRSSQQKNQLNPQTAPTFVR